MTQPKGGTITEINIYIYSSMVIVQKSSKAKRRVVPLRPCNFPLKSHTTSVYSNHTNIIYLIFIYVQKWKSMCIYWYIYICVYICVQYILYILYIYIRHSNSVVQSWSLQKQFLVVDLDDLLDFGTKWHGQHTELHEGLGMDNREHPSGIPMLSTAPTTGFNKFTLTQ